MSFPDVDALVRTNLARVRERIAAAAERAGRSPDEVRLVGVTKYVGVEATMALVRAGCARLGEARPQQLWQKVAALDDGPFPQQWHLIGHLQRNKVARTCDCTAAVYLHAVDGLKLLAAINRSVEGRGWRAPVTLEVNVSGDPEKHGLPPEELPAVCERLAEYPHVGVTGLMTMAAREGGESVARQNFAALRELRDRLATPELPLPELSMGMSGDFEAAIAEGSTLVRIGSALWEGVL